MNATELRLNNYVICNYNTDLISKVDWIQHDSIAVCFDRQQDLVNGCHVSPIDLKGIPLTEEWILKFGFNKIAGVLNLNTGYVEFNYFPLIRGFEMVIEGQALPLYKLQFIHQLQNLYHSICGEELLLKSSDNQPSDNT